MREGLYLWAVVGGFLIGVAARSLLPLGLSWSVFILLLALLGAFLIPKKREMLLFVCALVAFATGIARMDAAVMRGDPALTAHLGEEVTIEGSVFQEPDARDASTRLFVKADRLISKYAKEQVKAGVLVQIPPHANISYGDRVRAFGTLRAPEAFDTDGGRQFDYPGYLAAQGISYQLSFAQAERSGESVGNPLKAFALGAKSAYLRGIQATLPEPEAGLAGGITVGDKRSIGPELSADFQRASLVHMLVLSGYNITVILNAVAHLVSHAPRPFQFGASGLTVVFFILMSGGASSAVRAGLMALLAVYARGSRRVFLASRALGVTACAMVLYQPFILIFDPSFQLSVLATFGLISFTPIFSRWLSWVPARFALREIAASTLGTQLAVLPLLLYQSGTLSLVALPANLLALFPVPLAMLFSFIASLGGILFGSYAALLATPAYALLWYIIAVARLFGELPFAAISLPAFSAWWLPVAYTLLFAFALRFRGEEDTPRA